MRRIDVDAANAFYCSENGILFNKDKTQIVYYPAGKSETYYIISDTIKDIADGAFWECNSLKNVYYTGTAEEWSAINIGVNNTSLTAETLYYYSEELTEEQKADVNNYWHWDTDGVTPVIWVKEII